MFFLLHAADWMMYVPFLGMLYLTIRQIQHPDAELVPCGDDLYGIGLTAGGNGLLYGLISALFSEGDFQAKVARKF
jgi:hypothetical protein